MLLLSHQSINHPCVLDSLLHFYQHALSLLGLVSVHICGLFTGQVLLLPQQADSKFVGWPLLFLAASSLPLSFSFFTCCFSNFSWAFFISFSLLLMVERSLWLETPSSWKTTHINIYIILLLIYEIWNINIINISINTTNKNKKIYNKDQP